MFVNLVRWACADIEIPAPRVFVDTLVDLVELFLFCFVLFLLLLAKVVLTFIHLFVNH